MTTSHYSFIYLNGQEVELYVNALFANNAKSAGVETTFLCIRIKQCYSYRVENLPALAFCHHFLLSHF